MAIFIILLLLLLVLLSSAEAASGPFRVPKLRWHQWFFLFLSSAFLGCLFEMGAVAGNRRSDEPQQPALRSYQRCLGAGRCADDTGPSPLRRYGKWAVFGSGVILGGGFEYLTSLLLERVFQRLFWDYSYLPLNLDGRTNFLYAVFWGLAGVVWVYWLAPYLLRLAEKIPRKADKPYSRDWRSCLLWICPLSAAAFWRMEERSRGSVPSNYLEYMLDTWYGDQAMQQRYQNMELPHPVS